LFSERRAVQRFRMKLPLTVRWTIRTIIEEAPTESRGVSSRSVCFFLPKRVKNGSSVEIVLTLPHEITLTGPVRVRCTGRVQRSEDKKEEGRLGVVATIECHEFLRDDENVT
jgi:hypothetical protein